MHQTRTSTLTLIALLAWTLVGLGCRPPQRTGLGDGPPQISKDTVVLPVFDPSALAGRGANPALAQAVSGPPQPPAPPPLPAPAVVEHGPTAEASRYPTIQIRFNRPMVELGEKTRMSAEAAGFTFTPKLEGEAYWLEPNRLVFAPKTALPSASTWEVAFRKKVEAFDGAAVDVDLSWSFSTEPPRLSMTTAHDAQMDGRSEHHWKARVLVDSNHTIALAQLRRHTHAHVRDANGDLQPVEIAIRELKPDKYGYRPHAFEIRPKTRWPADTEVVIEVDAGLTSSEGPRPMPDAFAYSFYTTAGVEGSGLTCVEGEHEDGCELGPLLVHFTAPISQAQAKHLKISPAPKGLDVLPVDRERVSDASTSTGYRSLMIWGDFQRGVDYHIEVGTGLRDVYGQPLQAEVSDEVRFVEPPPSLAVSRGIGTLQPSRGAKLGVESRHVEQLRVRVAKLDPGTYEAVLRSERILSSLSYSHDDVITLPDIGRWGWSSFELDLSRYTNNGPGTLLVEVSPAKMLARAAGRKVPATQHALVQLTELGITAVSSLPGGVVRVAKLADDTPVAGAEIEVIDDDPPHTRTRIGKTDADGLLRLPPAAELPGDTLVRVYSGNESLLLAADDLYAHAGPGSGLRHGEQLQATVMTERPLYKPGERVRVMGWATISTPYEFSGLRRVPGKSEVVVELRDPHGELVETRTVRTKDHGKFWATLDLPATGSLGRYAVWATLLGSTHEVRLRVEDFETPEFAVTASTDRSDIHGGESVEISVDADYFFGGRVPIKRARKVDECVEIDFRPPGLEPSWSVAPRRPNNSYGRIGSQPTPHQLPPSGANGHLEYSLQLRRKPVGQTLRCKHSVAIADASERELGAEATIWVHPEFYLASRAPNFVEPGQDAEIELRTMDFDGKALPVDEIVVTLERSWYEPEFTNKRFAGWRERSKKLPPCKVRSEGQATCSFAKLEHGSYAITVTAASGDYEPIVEDWLWVPEPDGYRPYVAPDKLAIEFDRARVAVGDKVRARVRAPWKQGNGVVLLDKGGVHGLRPFTLVDGQAELEYVIDDAWIPGAKLLALAVEPGTTSTLPHLRQAKAELDVATDSRALAVEIEIPSEAQTGERMPITVRVHDSAGQPTAGHVSVWAVDEALLSLEPLRLPDFVAAFATETYSPIATSNSYDALLLPFVSRPDDYRPRAFKPGWASGIGGGELYGYGSGAGYGAIGLGNTGLIGHGGGGGSGGGVPMPSTRSEFSSAPIFIGDAVVGPDGVAELHGELPDNLTTFRVTAVASASLPAAAASNTKPVEARFGSGDARVRVTRPLVVRAAMPRIMRPGDVAEIGVLVDNRQASAGTVEIEVALHEADGVLELLSQAKQRVAIEQGGQIRVPFTVRALASSPAPLPGSPGPSRGATGTPQFEVHAQLQDIGDALRLPLPVEPERTLTDRVAVYGSLADDGAALLPFAIPADADRRFGGLSISVGTTLLGGLEDAVAYLVRYPHGCVEQTSSSLLPLVPLGRLATQGYPLGIDDVDAYVAHGITRLRSMQQPDGGFSYWPGGRESAPYASAYATWVLGRAHAAGYAVPTQMFYDALDYVLTRVEAWAKHTAPGIPHDIEAALMLATLAEHELAPSEALDALYLRRRNLPVFAQAQLLLAIDAHASAKHLDDPRRAELLRELVSLVDEREAVAKVESDRAWTWYWDSNTRSSAILLMAMLRVEPEHPLAAKLARGLLEVRRGGRWSNTQENAWGLLALADYAAIYEADEPNFDGRVWLGQRMLGSVHAEGRSFGFDEGFTAMDELLGHTSSHDPDAGNSLLLERAGVGRMYYRVGLEWASTATDKPAKAEGIRIERTLRGEAGPVGEDQAVHAGELLAIDVDIEVPAALDHVAIEIPLPAGLQAVNLDLGQGTSAMKLAGSRGYWVSHQELRRDRAVLFADHIEPGTYKTTVFLRATTPGEYVMPAGHAEMMYYPEVYGRTTTRRLLVR